MEAARTNARFLLAELRARRRPASCVVARARTSPTPRTTRRCSRRCARSPSSTTSRGSPRRAAVADELLRLFHDAEAAGSSRPASDAEQLVVRLEGPLRRRDAVGELARRQRAAPARRADRRRPARGRRRSRCCGCSRRPARRTRTASRICSARSSGSSTSPVEIAIVGDPDDDADRGLAPRGHGTAASRRR